MARKTIDPMTQMDLGLIEPLFEQEITKKLSGFWLSDLWIHNWFSVADLHIPLEGKRGLHLEGDSGVGKTTILDALLWAIIGDAKMVGFNRAASSRESGGGRSLKSYVHWTDHGQVHREKGTSFVLLEFHNLREGDRVTIGSVMDFNMTDVDSRFVIARASLSKNMVSNANGKIFSAREIENLYHQLGIDAKVYRQAYAYRADLMRVFEGLPERFFEDLGRLSGQHDPSNLNDFIREFLFENEPTISLDDLAEQVRLYRETQDRLKKAQERISQLDRVQKKATDWQSLTLQERAARLTEYYAQAEHARKLETNINQEIARYERLQGETQAELITLRERIDAAAREKDAAQARLSADQSSWEAERIRQDVKQWTRELEKQSGAASDVRSALARLRAWFAAVPPMLASGAEIAGEPIPSHILPSLEEAFSADPVNMDAIREKLRELIIWASRAKLNLEARQRELQLRLSELKERISDLSQGIVSDTREIYQLRDVFRTRFGQVDILCDLVEQVDQDWQQVIESRLGKRRFALVVPKEKYEDCMRAVRDLPEERQYEIFVINPYFVMARGKFPRQGSLAEKVSSSHPIAQAFMNQALNSWTAFSSDEEAWRADDQGVSQTGFVNSGGTVNRARPVLLTFGQAARQQQREQAESEQSLVGQALVQLNNQIESIDSITQNLSRQAENADRVRQDPLEREFELRQQISESQRRLSELESTGDWLALAEQVRQAESQHENLIERRGALNEKLKSYQELLDKQREDLHKAETSRLDWDHKFADIDATSVKWRDTFDRMMVEARNSLEQTAIAAHAQAEATHRQAMLMRGDLRDLVVAYITQYSPPGVTGIDFEEMLEACLKEYHTLTEVKVLELQHSLNNLRAAADEALLRKFLDRLRMEHRKIRNDIRSLNHAIDGVRLGRRTYQFDYKEVSTPTLQAVLHLLHRYDEFNAQQVSDLSTKLREVAEPGLIERLYEVFSPVGQPSVEDDRLRNVLLTPARYFIFDLKASDNGGEWFMLSDHYRSGSGGEHQNPLYIILTASMLQMYDNKDRRPRLVIIDEAFSKAPGSSQNGLDMLLEQGLQPIVATPIGRPDVEETLQNTLHVFRDKNQLTRTIESGFINQELEGADA